MVESVLEGFVRDPAKKQVPRHVLPSHHVTHTQHSFPPMKYEERLIVHELAAIYGPCSRMSTYSKVSLVAGLGSESFDQDPHRNVVVTRLATIKPLVPKPLLSELAPAASATRAPTASRLVSFASLSSAPI